MSIQPFPTADQPLSVLEQRVFGMDAKRHPITCLPLKSGSGAHSAGRQAEEHCRTIEAVYGKEKADEMRKRLIAARELIQEKRR